MVPEKTVFRDSHGGGVPDEAEVGVETNNLGRAAIKIPLEEMQLLNVKVWQFRGGRGRNLSVSKKPPPRHMSHCLPCPAQSISNPQSSHKKESKKPAAKVDDSVPGPEKGRQAELLSPGQARQVVHRVQPDRQFCLKCSWSFPPVEACPSFHSDSREVTASLLAHSFSHSHLLILFRLTKLGIRIKLEKAAAILAFVIFCKILLKLS